MKIALFASGGDIPVAAVEALHPVAEVALVVRPGPVPGLGEALKSAATRLVRGPARPDALSLRLAELGIPERRMRGPEDPGLAPQLRGMGIDLACVATFPWRLRPDVLAAARLGTTNTHASLLPRHRGPNPWFWTYHADDREAGVTVHVCDARIDAGAILRQLRWPLARGFPVAALHLEVADRGAELLREVVKAMDGGAPAATPQDPARVTRARRVPRGVPMVDPTWPVERTWHFLAGLVGQYHEPLACAGAPVTYDRVSGFETTEPRSSVGTVERLAGRHWRLWCRDGAVQLERTGA